jgi:hypothetical protein
VLKAKRERQRFGKIHRNTSWHSAKIKFKVRNLYNIDDREGASLTS